MSDPVVEALTQVIETLRVKVADALESDASLEQRRSAWYAVDELASRLESIRSQVSQQQEATIRDAMKFGMMRGAWTFEQAWAAWIQQASEVREESGS